MNVKHRTASKNGLQCIKGPLETARPLGKNLHHFYSNSLAYKRYAIPWLHFGSRDRKQRPPQIKSICYTSIDSERYI